MGGSLHKSQNIVQSQHFAPSHDGIILKLCWLCTKQGTLAQEWSCKESGVEENKEVE